MCGNYRACCPDKYRYCYFNYLYGIPLIHFCAYKYLKIIKLFFNKLICNRIKLCKILSKYINK